MVNEQIKWLFYYGATFRSVLPQLPQSMSRTRSAGKLLSVFDGDQVLASIVRDTTAQAVEQKPPKRVRPKQEEVSEPKQKKRHRESPKKEEKEKHEQQRRQHNQMREQQKDCSHPQAQQSVKVKHKPKPQQTQGKPKPKLQQSQVKQKSSQQIEKEKQKQLKYQKTLAILQKIKEIRSQKPPEARLPAITTVKTPLKDTLVDQYYPRPNLVKVYADQNGPYSATFNHTSVEKNINKFYIMQVLQSNDDPNQCYFYTRYGRVGLEGQNSEAGPVKPEEAVQSYNNKMEEKLKKNYKIIEITYEQKRRNFYYPMRKEKDLSQIPSTLEPRVQSLIRLIFDMKMMNNQLKSIGIDANKMPLGKIAKSCIIKGYEALKELIEEIKGKRRKENISQWSNAFYSQIPHDFGMKNICNYVLDTEKKIKDKLEMLQSLEDIQVFSKLIDEANLDSQINQLDANYLKLQVQITPLEKEDPVYRTILRYVENTHAPTHKYGLEVETVYSILSPIEEERYAREIPNKQLLCHGSRLTNFVGILSQGIRIAPPEAPVTGYMFGKGVYFADVISKSGNYCHTSKMNNQGLILLCEVALGNCNQQFYANYYANLMPQGKNSTKGMGKVGPIKQQGEYLEDVFVPNGKLQSTGITNTSLQYNQYVVYDLRQIRCRYLLKLKFTHP